MNTLVLARRRRTVSSSVAALSLLAIASGVMPCEMEQPAAKRTWHAIESSLSGIVCLMYPDVYPDGSRT